MNEDFDRKAKTIVTLLKMEDHISAIFTGVEYNYSIKSYVTSLQNRYIVMKAESIRIHDDRYIIFDTNNGAIIGVLLPKIKSGAPTLANCTEIIEEYKREECTIAHYF